MSSTEKLLFDSRDRLLVEQWVERELTRLREANDVELSVEKTAALRGAIACCKKLRKDLLLEEQRIEVYMSELPGDY